MTITRPRPTAEFIRGGEKDSLKKLIVSRQANHRFSYLSYTVTFTSFGLVEPPLEHFSCEVNC